MNEYVRVYQQLVENKLTVETNEDIYRVVASMIANFGTIEDLKALDIYYREDINNENNSTEKSQAS